MRAAQVTEEERRMCREEEERSLYRTTCISGLKSAASYAAKKLIFFVVVTGFTVAGAYMFQSLEAPNELKMCFAQAALYDQLELSSAQQLEEIGLSYMDDQGSDPSQLLSNLQRALLTFRNDVLLLQYDGRNCSLLGTPQGLHYKWNLFGSMLFATTVFSTVGYGNIAPVTSWGRIVTIAYAMITIPIFIAFLASIGSDMANTFRYVYVNLCCLGQCRRFAIARQAKERRRLREQAAAAAAATQLAAAKAFAQQNRRYKMRGQYPSTADGVSTKQSVDDTIFPNNVRHDKHEVPGEHKKAVAVHSLVFDDEGEDEEDYEIPMSIVLILFLVFSYVGLGAILFANWQGWDVMTGAYYCFVTISTIGFGDIVPGYALNGVQSNDDELQMLGALIYMILGMAFISMAFSLLQEEMAVKFKKKEGVKDWEEKVDEAPGTGTGIEGEQLTEEKGEGLELQPVKVRPIYYND